MFLGLSTIGERISIGLASMTGSPLSEHTTIATRTLSENLITHIETLCAEHVMTLQDIQGVGVLVGPGTYTSLRIGVTVAKSIGQVLDIPVYGISTFDGLIYPFRAINGLYFSVIPARANELNWAMWNTQSQIPTRLSPDLCMPVDRFVRIVSKINGTIYIVGSIPDTLKTLLADHKTIRVIETIPSGMCAAQIALNRFHTAVAPGRVVPVYSHQPFTGPVKKP